MKTDDAVMVNMGAIFDHGSFNTSEKHSVWSKLLLSIDVNLGSVLTTYKEFPKQVLRNFESAGLLTIDEKEDKKILITVVDHEKWVQPCE